MPTPLEKRIVINAMRAADHQVEALIGNIRIVEGLLKQHGWDSASRAERARHEAKDLQASIDILHESIFDEAIAKREEVPTDGIIQPMSGGGSKGGGG
jgi:hypothetical protein